MYSRTRRTGNKQLLMPHLFRELFAGDNQLAGSLRKKNQSALQSKSSPAASASPISKKISHLFFHFPKASSADNAEDFGRQEDITDGIITPAVSQLN